jgi:hypothetical protein
MNRALLTIGLAAMQVCWIFPWTLLVVRWAQGDPERPLLGAASMLALLLLGALATRLVIRFVGVRRGGQITLVALGVLVVLAAVRLDYFADADMSGWLGAQWGAVAVMLGHPTLPALALGLALVLWWRGVQLGSSTPSFPEVDTAFRWNIGALIAFVLIVAVGTRPSQRPLLETQATPFVVGSFFVSLLTLALARLESLRTRTRALSVNGQWLGVLIAVAGLLVLLALAVAQVLSFDLLLVATRPIFDLLGRVLLVLLYIIVVPLAYVVELLAYWLLSLISPDPNREQPEPMSPGDINAWLERLLNQTLSPEVQDALKAIGAVLVLGLALLLVARAVGRWRPRAAETDATLEERDSVFDAARVWAALRAWLRALFRRSRAAAGAPAQVPSAAAQAETPALASVRELYRRLLTLGEAAGSYRAPATTPYEHRPALEGALEPPHEIAWLTEAYVQVRYAEDEPTSEEVEELRERLERVHPPE